MRVSQNDLNQLLALAMPDLLALKDARLFITGGTGYIGRWLLESVCHANQALNLGASVTVLSRDPDRFAAAYPHLGNDPAIHLTVGDIRNFAFPNEEFTHAVHAATDVIAANTALETFDVTVAGTRRLLEFCKQQKIKDVLLLSSGAVYGRIPHHIDLVPEDYSGLPSLDTPGSAYGIGKIATEWLGNTYSSDYGIACKSARIFAQVGPYLALDKQFAAGNFILNALQGEPFLIKGDGTPRRSYMYATDLVAWLWAILIRGQARRAYNVGSDHSISIGDLAIAVAKAAGVSDPKIEILGKPSAQTPPERYVPDISRSRNELGLTISVPLEDALQRTLEWYRPHFDE